MPNANKLARDVLAALGRQFHVQNDRRFRVSARAPLFVDAGLSEEAAQAGLDRLVDKKLVEDLGQRTYKLSAEGANAIMENTGDQLLPISLASGAESWSSDIADYCGRVHFAIVTIKIEEEKQILARFPRKHSIRGRRMYGFSRINNAQGETVVVATVRQPSQGNIEASTITGDIIADLKPAWILLVGVAGATPFGDAIPGDVVLGTHVHDLTVHVRNADGGTAFSAKGGPTTADVQATAVHLLPVLDEIMVSQKWHTKPEHRSLEFTTEDEEIVAKIKSALERSNPKVLDGHIVSTDALVKDPDLVKVWKETMRNGLAIEMESAGAYAAARTVERTFAMLPIRGISDIVGLKKTEGGVAHACEIAAECAFQFVRMSPAPKLIEESAAANP